MFEIRDQFTPSRLPVPVNDNHSAFLFIDKRKCTKRFIDLTKGDYNGKEKN